jgi:preprotein translocase subunit SecD
VRFNRDGTQRMLQLTAPNVSHAVHRSGEFRYLGILLDGELIATQMLFSAVHRDLPVTGAFDKDELAATAAVLRGGTLPVRLNPRPVRETTFDPGH